MGQVAVGHRRDRRPDELARDRFGEATVVELVGLLGNYSAVALVLNAFEVDPPKEAR